MSTEPWHFTTWLDLFDHHAVYRSICECFLVSNARETLSIPRPFVVPVFQDHLRDEHLYGCERLSQRLQFKLGLSLLHFKREAYDKDGRECRV